MMDIASAAERLRHPLVFSLNPFLRIYLSIPHGIGAQGEAHRSSLIHHARTDGKRTTVAVTDSITLLRYLTLILSRNWRVIWNSISAHDKTTHLSVVAPLTEYMCSLQI